MAEFPALPLWVDAYMADCEHLTDAENGVYLKVLMVMWRSPECRIPNDDAWLARRFRRDVHAVRETIRPILAEFCKTDGNWVWQSRLIKEHEHCKKKSAKNSESAKAMWENKKQLSERNAPIPIPIPKERDRGAVAPRTGLKAFLPEDWSLPAEWLAEAKRGREDAGLPALDWQAEAARFKAHWLHPDSKNRKKSDWRRTWLKWCMSAYAKPAEQSSRPSMFKKDAPGAYVVPTYDPAENWEIKADAFVKIIKSGRGLGAGANDHDVLRLVREGRVTQAECEKVGYSLWNENPEMAAKLKRVMGSIA